MEIERKFLLRKIPDWARPVSKWEIHQVYIHKGKNVQLRVRRKIPVGGGPEEYTMTNKIGRGLVRQEHEVPISAETYWEMQEKSGRKPVVKMRTVVDCAVFLMEVDEHDGKRMKIAEVEFGDVASARAFVPPAWLGREITEEAV